MNRIKLIILLSLVIGSLFAQDLSKLTPDQMEMYNKYMAGKGATSPVATQVPKDQVIERSVDANESVLIVPKKIDTQELSVFGSYLFNDQNLTFEPKLNIPTPTNYILGTYDELIIDVSGLYEANYKLKVSPEGLIRIPNVGPLRVAGQTIASATKAIKNQVSSVFTGISSGQTTVNVSLGTIRSIRIAVVGEAVRPGSYTLPSLATAFNALYACGGPNKTGTMRDIKVVRGGTIIAHLDVYKYLNEGLLLNNVVLQDEDIIRIDPYEIRTMITGAVKRIGIYEAKKNESIKNLIQYAGGFTENAYKDKITVFRYTNKEKTVIDVNEAQFGQFGLHAGDSLVVATTTNRYDNKIDITGAVFHPGTYALEPGMTVKQLITKAGGLKEDAFMKIAFINRIQTNKIPENIGFNLEELLNDNLKDILLQKDDQLVIKSLFDYRNKQEVTIVGSVRNPGKYELKENTKLKDLIFLAGGFLEVASTDSIELVRMIKDPTILLNSDEKSTVRKLALDKDFNLLDGADSISLENGDQLIIRSISGYEGIRMVRVEGEVIHPGSYNIRNKAERISDVVNRAGGFSQFAYKSGAFLIRAQNVNEIERKLNNNMVENTRSQLENVSNKTVDANVLKATGANTIDGYSRMDSLQQKLSGAMVVDKIFAPESIVGLDMDEIMRNKGGKFDLKLEENDIIYVPRELQTVRVLGQVLFPTLVRYDRTMCLKDFVNNSGGFALNANRNKVFVLYANGRVKGTKRFLGLRIYPNIQPGSRIVVPEKPVELKNKLTTAETVAILTSITSSVALIYSIISK